jgi:hypothetical protein
MPAGTACHQEILGPKRSETSHWSVERQLWARTSPQHKAKHENESTEHEEHENDEFNANETALPRDLCDGNDGSASDGAGLYDPA